MLAPKSNRKNKPIPLQVAEMKDKKIPSQVAKVRGEKHIEEQPFLISFAKYNNRVCEVENLKRNKAKKSLQVLIKIGRDFFDYEDFEKDKGIEKIPVRNKGEYKKLFQRLHPDVELFEHKLQGKGRIFYYINDLEKLFCVVAIKENHFETKRQRR